MKWVKSHRYPNQTIYKESTESPMMSNSDWFQAVADSGLWVAAGGSIWVH